MAVTRNAAACPLPQVSTTLRLLSDAYASSSGTAPASRSFVQGESANLRPKLNENALRLDLSSRFGGGVRAVAQGLAVTAAGLVGTVAAGQCLIDGIAEIPASVTGLAMVDNTWNYFWVQQAPGGTASVVVTQSTTAPSNSVFIGAVQVTGGVAGTPDTSGVVYARGGMRWRQAADATVPGDTPPADVMLFTRTAGGLYLWDGSGHTLMVAQDGIGSLFVNTADSTAVANTTTETNFDVSYSVPAALWSVGRVLRVTASGKVSAHSSPPTLRLRLKAGSVTLLDLAAQNITASLVNGEWRMSVILVCRSTGGTGTLAATLQQALIDAVTVGKPQNVATVDLTTAQTLQVSAQWSAANAANTATLETLLIERLS